MYVCMYWRSRWNEEQVDGMMKQRKEIMPTGPGSRWRNVTEDTIDRPDLPYATHFAQRHNTHADIATNLSISVSSCLTTTQSLMFAQHTHTHDAIFTTTQFSTLQT